MYYSHDSRQKMQLRKMIGFKFTRHPGDKNLPEEHLLAAEKHLRTTSTQTAKHPQRLGN